MRNGRGRLFGSPMPAAPSHEEGGSLLRLEKHSVFVGRAKQERAMMPGYQRASHIRRREDEAGPVSIHVMSWVLKNSETRLGERLVLLVLADHADEAGKNAWVSVNTISL